MNPPVRGARRLTWDDYANAIDAFREIASGSMDWKFTDVSERIGVSVATVHKYYHRGSRANKWGMPIKDVLSGLSDEAFRGEKSWREEFGKILAESRMGFPPVVVRDLAPNKAPVVTNPPGRLRGVGKAELVEQLEVLELEHRASQLRAEREFEATRRRNSLSIADLHKYRTSLLRVALAEHIQLRQRMAKLGDALDALQLEIVRQIEWRIENGKLDLEMAVTIYDRFVAISERAARIQKTLIAETRQLSRDQPVDATDKKIKRNLDVDHMIADLGEQLVEAICVDISNDRLDTPAIERFIEWTANRDSGTEMIDVTPGRRSAAESGTD